MLELSVSLVANTTRFRAVHAPGIGMPARSPAVRRVGTALVLIGSPPSFLMTYQS